MADGPSVKRIKSEKRNLQVEPAPAGMSRRRFLTYLGTGSAALAAGSAGLLTGCAESEEQGQANGGSGNGGSQSAAPRSTRSRSRRRRFARSSTISPFRASLVSYRRARFVSPLR